MTEKPVRGNFDDEKLAGFLQAPAPDAFARTCSRPPLKTDRRVTAWMTRP